MLIFKRIGFLKVMIEGHIHISQRGCIPLPPHHTSLWDTDISWFESYTQTKRNLQLELCLIPTACETQLSWTIGIYKVDKELFALRVLVSSGPARRLCLILQEHSFLLFFLRIFLFLHLNQSFLPPPLLHPFLLCCFSPDTGECPKDINQPWYIKLQWDQAWDQGWMRPSSRRNGSPKQATESGTSPVLTSRTTTLRPSYTTATYKQRALSQSCAGFLVVGWVSVSHCEPALLDVIISSLSGVPRPHTQQAAFRKNASSLQLLAFPGSHSCARTIGI